MCGLVGASSPSKNKIKKSDLVTLMLYNERRGEDSAGFWDGNQEVITKVTGKVSESMLPEQQINDCNIFIGHTRKSTMGHDSVTTDNAHPFHFGKVIGAHNGTLKHWKDYVILYGLDEEEVTIDSKLIFKTLDKFNNYKVLQELSGAATVLFSKKDGYLYVWRQGDRDLFRGVKKSPSGKTQQMFFSSLEASLSAIGCTNVQEVKINTLYMVKDGEIVKHKRVVNRPLEYGELQKAIRKIQGVAEPVYARNQTSSALWDSDTGAWKPAPSCNHNTYDEEEERYERQMDTNAYFNGGKQAVDSLRSSQFSRVGSKTVDNPSRVLDYQEDLSADKVSELYYNHIYNRQTGTHYKSEKSVEVTEINALEPLIFDAKVIAAAAHIQSGFSTEQLLLVTNEIAQKLFELGSTLDGYTLKDIVEEDVDLSKTLHYFSDVMKEKILNIIKNNQIT
jgi:hypothetical protein